VLGPDVSVIAHVIERNAARYPDKVALASPGARVSFGEFAARAQRLAANLACLGLAKGSRVAILSRNRPEYLEVICASVAGFIAVPLNWRLSLQELGAIIAECEPEVIISDKNFIDMTDALRRDAVCVKHVFCFDQAPAQWLDYSEILRHPPDREELARVAPDDTACLLYTSGTTGAPKGAELTHGALLRNCKAAIRYVLKLQSADITLAPMPFFHVGGLWYHLFPSFAAGCTTFILPEFNAGAVLATIERTRATNVHVVPSMLHAMLEHPDIGSVDLSSLRLVLYAASSIPLELLKRAMSALAGCAFVQSYGSTEAGLVTRLTDHDHRSALSCREREGLLLSCGRPLPQVDVRLQDEMHDERYGVVGEISVRSSMSMARYWRKPEATSVAYADGWFRTGDIGRRDAEGYLYILDRKNDMIITGGENVFPREVEETLLQDPVVSEAAVFDVPDPKWVQKIVAAVVLQPDCSATAEEIIVRARERLAAYKCPKEVFVVSALPRSAAGKVLRRSLRVEFGSKTPGS
jgi:acyl-CoA synthetase (AMP-forming)/AMP-acid ligase II